MDAAVIHFHNPEMTPHVTKISFIRISYKKIKYCRTAIQLQITKRIIKDNMVIKNALCIHAITIKQKLLTSVASFENVIKTQMSGREKIYETYL